MPKPTVSIITVNYYSEEEILGCYSSILKCSSDIEFELILVSNSFLDPGFESKLKNLSNKIVIFQNDSNEGFAKACNKGAKLASGDFLFFLNPDTRFLNDVLKHLFECLQQFEQSAIVGPSTYDENRKSVPSAKYNLSKFYFWELMFPFLKKLYPSSAVIGHFTPEETEPVPVVNGHAMFIPKKVFNKVGGFEEKFFMYWEENDLCLKIQDLNLDVLYCHEAKILHKSGTSTRPFFLNMEVAKHRSQRLFILKHYSKWNLLNRVSGIIGYLWRTIGSLLIADTTKTKQFWHIFKWYLFNYK